MALDLLKRSEKGIALTSAEHDVNFTAIETEVNKKADEGHQHTLSDVTDAGTAAAEDVGTGVGNVVQLEDIGGGTPSLPAIDGSQLTGLPGGGLDLGSVQARHMSGSKGVSLASGDYEIAAADPVFLHFHSQPDNTRIVYLGAAPASAQKLFILINTNDDNRIAIHEGTIASPGAQLTNIQPETWLIVGYDGTQWTVSTRAITLEFLQSRQSATPELTDKVWILDATDNFPKLIDIQELPTGASTDTASNVGTGGVGVFHDKVAGDFQFRHIAPADDKLNVALIDADIEISVDEAQFEVPAGSITSGTLDDARISASSVRQHQKYFTPVDGTSGGEDISTITSEHAGATLKLDQNVELANNFPAEQWFVIENTHQSNNITISVEAGAEGTGTINGESSYVLPPGGEVFVRCMPYTGDEPIFEARGDVAELDLRAGTTLDGEEIVTTEGAQLVSPESDNLLTANPLLWVGEEEDEPNDPPGTLVLLLEPEA